MKWVRLFLAVLAALPAGATNAQQDKPVNLMITAVFVDAPEAGQLTILGQDFDQTEPDAEPLIVLGDMPLETEPLDERDQGSKIIAHLPVGVADGDYRLTVSLGAGAGRSRSYHLTIGSVGPPGPPGVRGARGFSGRPGARGPPGSAGQGGRDAFAVCAWYGSDSDLFGSGPLPYSNNTIIHQSGDTTSYFAPLDWFAMVPGVDAVEIRASGLIVYSIVVAAIAADPTGASVEIRLNPSAYQPASGLLLGANSARGEPVYLYASVKALLKQGDIISAVFASHNAGRLYSRSDEGGSFLQICADFKAKAKIELEGLDRPGAETSSSPAE